MRSARTLVLYTLVLYHATTLPRRISEWHSNQTIWRAAARTDNNDPRALVNAAVAINGQSVFPSQTVIAYYERLISLPIPAFLPDQERQGYVQGYMNYSAILGKLRQYAKADALANRAERTAPSIFRPRTTPQPR